MWYYQMESGEDMEQLFSFLSRFNLTTKNMSAAGISVLFDIPSIVCIYIFEVESRILQAEKSSLLVLQYFGMNGRLRAWQLCSIRG